MAEKILSTRIQHRRDTSANWTTVDPVILKGELILVDTAEGELRSKIGDGTKTYTQLPFTDETLRSLISAGTNSSKDIYYGTCTTAAGTAAKVVTLTDSTGFTLQAGTMVAVKFSANNTASNPTLNVASSGAKSIMQYGTTAVGNGNQTVGWIAGAIQIFVYDGTNWIRDYWANTDTTYTNQATLGQGYGTCATAAATTAKAVTLASYELVTGGIVAVKFTYDVPAGATMNVNSKGAKSIYHRGAAIAGGVIKAGDTATFVYNGTQYHLLTVDRQSAESTIQPVLYGLYYFNEVMTPPRAAINESLTNIEFGWSDGYATELTVSITADGSCSINPGDTYQVYTNNELVWEYGRDTAIRFWAPATVSQALYDWFEANTSRDLADTTQLTNRVSELENQVVTLATQIMPHVVGEYVFNSTMLPPAENIDISGLYVADIHVDNESVWSDVTLPISVTTAGTCEIDNSFVAYSNFQPGDWSTQFSIDFGSTPQLVSKTFYNWLLANTDRTGVIDASEVAM
jgi:hypothetical protein